MAKASGSNLMIPCSTARRIHGECTEVVATAVEAANQLSVSRPTINANKITAVLSQLEQLSADLIAEVDSSSTLSLE
jgi:hypothetical protein